MQLQLVVRQGRQGLQATVNLTRWNASHFQMDWVSSGSTTRQVYWQQPVPSMHTMIAGALPPHGQKPGVRVGRSAIWWHGFSSNAIMIRRPPMCIHADLHILSELQHGHSSALCRKQQHGLPLKRPKHLVLQMNQSNSRARLEVSPRKEKAKVRIG